ncbi:MAG: hypothetical protein M5U09_19375 [Gammaproteobacteria bacterium]|nr:hypothetical protein [Gammaproteobacteria bacterium]
MIASTCLASCLPLWGLGLKYGSDTPRLTGNARRHLPLPGPGA